MDDKIELIRSKLSLCEDEPLAAYLPVFTTGEIKNLFDYIDRLEKLVIYKQKRLDEVFEIYGERKKNEST